MIAAKKTLTRLLYRLVMPSTPPRERLTRLVDLASEPSSGSRQELTKELADLLLDWPESYPAVMREPFEALLERTLHDIEPSDRGLLAERFARGDIATSMLNALVFDAAPEIKIEILSRNVSADACSFALPDSCNEQTLLAAARATDTLLLPHVISGHFDISITIATSVLEDRSSYMLAALCKGAGLSRATFSALVVLSQTSATHDESYRRLIAYDAIPEAGARGLLRFWHSHTVISAAAVEAA